MAALAGTVASCSDADVASTALSPLFRVVKEGEGHREMFQHR